MDKSGMSDVAQALGASSLKWLNKPNFNAKFTKNKFRSRLVALQKHKLANGLETILCTYMPRGKKYLYASIKRGVK